MKKKFEVYYWDVTLVEVALCYMRYKKIKITPGNLFWVMEKICKKIDLINKNKKEKIINFIDGHCEIKMPVEK